MVIQYNNTGKAILPGNSVQDIDGNWIEVPESVQLETKCRVEPNKGNQYVIGSDGKQITFSSIVYMPISEGEIKPGTFFEVWEGERLIVKEPVKQFSKGQLNMRVWL